MGDLNFVTTIDPIVISGREKLSRRVPSRGMEFLKRLRRLSSVSGFIPIVQNGFGSRPASQSQFPNLTIEYSIHVSIGQCKPNQQVRFSIKCQIVNELHKQTVENDLRSIFAQSVAAACEDISRSGGVRKLHVMTVRDNAISALSDNNLSRPTNCSPLYVADIDSLLISWPDSPLVRRVRLKK